MVEVLRHTGTFSGGRPGGRGLCSGRLRGSEAVGEILACATGVVQEPRSACYRCRVAVLSWAMSSRLAARAAARSWSRSSSCRRRSMTCCSSWVMVWLSASTSAGAPRPDSCQACFAESFGEAFLQLPDPAVEPLGAFAGGEQVGLQRGAGDGRAGCVRRRPVGWPRGRGSGRAGRGAGRGSCGRRRRRGRCRRR